MGTTRVSHEDVEPGQPCIYEEDSHIPFAPDGNAPLIYDGVEKVKGVSAPFEGLKCVRKTLMVPSETDPAAELHQRRIIAQEVKILNSARHHHVIRLMHTYFDLVNKDQPKFAIVMDRAEANLLVYLKPGKSPPMQWFGCLISVIHYIHTLGIRHRDLKPSNILIKDGTVLLADFGISQMGLGKTMPTTYEHRKASRSPQYCAPEVDQGRTRGRSADIFSLGAIFLEMLVVICFPEKLMELNGVLRASSKSLPSYANRIEEVHDWIQRSLHPVGWQEEFLQTISGMLDPDRDVRPSAEAINKAWPSISPECDAAACHCARDVVLNKREGLVEACRAGSEEDVIKLLEDGAESTSLGAIHFAAARGSTTMVQALLDAGVPVDICNPVGQTALHCASRNGHEGVVGQLLMQNANVNARDENDQTPLHGASGHGYEGVVRILLNAGADVSAEDLDGSTSACFAARKHHKGVQTLLED